MYIQYKNDETIEVKKEKIDPLTKKALSQNYPGFEIYDFNKSWVDNEMQVSFYIKKGPIERTIRGIVKLNPQFIILEFEVPDIVKNFVTENKIERAIYDNLNTVFKENSL